jgi:cytochrome c oxidase assembly factor CtaG
VFVFAPGVIVLLGLVEFLYVRAVRVLARRGYHVPVRQQLSWHTGMALQAIALLGPLDVYADDLLSSHMAQHLLLADVAVPFLLIGMRTPVLVFLLPRPLLVPLAHRRRLRAVFRWLRQPIVAIGVYLFVLYFWHLAFAFEGALRHPLVHAAQHFSFVAIGVLVWWSALEPQRRRLRGELWKIPYIFASRMVSMFLGVAFVAARTPVYASYYGDRAREHGLTPISDQVIAGATMMSLDIVIMMAGLIFFFHRASVDHDRDEAREAAAATAAAAT